MAGGLDLSLEALQRARFSRDARFDGKFVIAVASSRIYCRPVCPVPFASVVRFYATAAEAETAGYRPCLRCRPEAAPGSPAWRGASATVSRALRLIEEGALDGGSVAALAERLGVGPRHLDRLVSREVGASPMAIAQTRRLHFAKMLLNDTALSITDIAMASGYGSVRRFNDAFKAAYRRAPGDVRRRARRLGEDASRLTLRLAYRPPFDWPNTVESLAREAIPGVEMLAEGRYVRLVRGKRGPLMVEIADSADARILLVHITGAVAADLLEVATSARRVFDLDADPARIVSAFAGDPLLGRSVAARPAQRIIGVWDRFEAVVRSVLANEPDIADPGASRAILGRLAERFGEAVDPSPGGPCRLFPSAAALADADLEACGVEGGCARFLRILAGAIASGTLALDAPAAAVMRDLEEAGLEGWRAQWVGLRAYGEPDAFPGAASVNARDSARPEAWRPWRGYAYFHLLRTCAGAAADQSSLSRRVV